MKIVNIKKDSKYLKEYIRLCSLEWGGVKIDFGHESVEML